MSTGGGATYSPDACADSVAVTVADHDVDAIADTEGLPVVETDADTERVVLAVFVGRGDLLPVTVAALLLDGTADGVIVSVGWEEPLADADADPEADGAADRVPVRVAVFVRVACGDFVISRVRVALALAPSGGGMDARADSDVRDVCDGLRLMEADG